MKTASKKEHVFILTDPWKHEPLLHGEYQGLLKVEGLVKEEGGTVGCGKSFYCVWEGACEVGGTGLAWLV